MAKPEELVGKLQGKLQKQTSELARMNQDRGAHLDHIRRLRRMLSNALENTAGWREEAEREVLHHSGK